MEEKGLGVPTSSFLLTLMGRSVLLLIAGLTLKLHKNTSKSRKSSKWDESLAVGTNDRPLLRRRTSDSVRVLFDKLVTCVQAHMIQLCLIHETVLWPKLLWAWLRFYCFLKYLCLLFLFILLSFFAPFFLKGPFKFFALLGFGCCGGRGGRLILKCLW